MNGKIEVVKPLEDKQLPGKLSVKVESLRCPNCCRFLMYFAVIEGTIAIKCRRCGAWVVLDVTEKLDNDGKR